MTARVLLPCEPGTFYPWFREDDINSRLEGDGHSESTIKSINRRGLVRLKNSYNRQVCAKPSPSGNLRSSTSNARGTGSSLDAAMCVIVKMWMQLYSNAVQILHVVHYI